MTFTTKDIFDHLRPKGLTNEMVDALYQLLKQGADLQTIAIFAGLKENLVPTPTPTSKFSFSQTSLNRLATVHPSLQKVVKRALEISPIDFTILEGERTVEQAYINYGKGRTAAELSAKGIPTKYAKPNEDKVTWLNNPLNSKHIKQKDGYSHAVDLAPYPINWKDLKRFDQVADAMFKAAAELGVTIRWGADWNGNGKFREKGESDSPHFEI